MSEERGPTGFEELADRKRREAEAASIQRLTTVFDRSDDGSVQRVGNAWSRLHYNGDFGVVTAPSSQTRLSLVFVQSQDRNTAASDPGSLGAGPTDQHLIYEGLSRVAADGVLAGAGTIYSSAFFSVWHPELVALRRSLGLPRHPAQIVVSKDGRVDLAAMLFNVPDVPIFLVCGEPCLSRHSDALRDRPWVRTIPFSGENLRPAIDRLRLEHGIARISAVGGRFTATHLVDEGLAQDIYLTTAPQPGGVPDTPWYAGTIPPATRSLVKKQWSENDGPVVFEHLLINR